MKKVSSEKICVCVLYKMLFSTQYAMEDYFEPENTKVH